MNFRAFIFLAAITAAVSIVTSQTQAGALARAYHVKVHAPGMKPVRIHVEERGHGPPILLVHGLGESTFTWRHVAPRLSPNHRVIAMDLKGFGQSEKPLDLEYTTQHQAKLVAAFIRQQGLYDITIIGHSLGGTVALLTAIELGRERHRIERLILIDAPVLHQYLPEPATAISVPAAPYALFGPAPPELFARIMLTFARRPGNPPSEADIRGYAKPFYELGSRHAFIITAQSIVEGDAWGWRKAFRRVRQPTHLIWCRHDEIVPLITGKKLKRMLPNASLTVLSGCNHLPQDEVPRKLTAVIRGFVGGE